MTRKAVCSFDRVCKKLCFGPKKTYRKEKYRGPTSTYLPRFLLFAGGFEGLSLCTGRRDAERVLATLGRDSERFLATLGRDSKRVLATLGRDSKRVLATLGRDSERVFRASVLAAVAVRVLLESVWAAEAECVQKETPQLPT